MIIAVVVLAVIGLGFGTFYSGILQGAETVGNKTIVKEATEVAGEFADNVTKSTAN